MSDIMITCQCPTCGKITYVPCSYEQYSRYMNTDTLIQDVFPDMDIHTRETIISGMCKPCQDKFFVEGDDCDGECDVCTDYECPGSVFHEEDCYDIESKRGK